MPHRHRLAVLVSLCLAVGCGDGAPDADSPNADESIGVRNGPADSLAGASASKATDLVTPSFRMIGAESGLDFERFDDISPLRRILEVNGGGVALFDFDGDDLLDVFFTNGCQLPVQEDDRRTPSALFRNRGELKFEQVSSQSGVLQFGFATGCTVGDYNSDGFADLYVTAYGPNTLWLNNGDGTFTNVDNAAWEPGADWSSSAAFADFNGDGHLDLYIVNYLQESAQSPTLCPQEGSPDGYVSCPPSKYDAVDDVLLISDGAGGFRDMTEQAGIAGLLGKGLGVVACDLDSRPGLEIYVANDGEPNFLFVRSGDDDASASPISDAGDGKRAPLEYAEQALLAGVALSEAGFGQASMGVASGDYNADGTIDLFLTHFFEDTNTLYANRDGLFFEDVTRQSRLGPSSRMMLGFGTEFLDFDNNGWLDLIVANGHIDDRTWMSDVEGYRMPPQFYRNLQDGTFVDVSGESGDYFQQQWLGRGLALGDLDRDGALDVAVSHQLAPSVVLHNQTDTPHESLTLRLIGTTANRGGLGTRVEVAGTAMTIMRELVGGGSFQSASAGEIHLGLGEQQEVTVHVRWPDGSSQTSTLTPGHWAIVEGQRAWPLSGPGRQPQGNAERHQ